MRRWLLLGVLLLGGCGSPTPSIPAGRVMRVSVSGQPAQVLVPSRVPNGPVVIVWFHSRDSDQTATTLAQRKPFFAALVRAGIVVASSRAGGNAWGNAASVASYRALIRWVTTRFAPSKIVLAGESMGGLASLQIASHPPPRVAGWIGISPVTSIAWARADREFRPEVLAERGSGPAGAVRLPALWFASPQDSTVPMGENRPRGALYVPCHGPHLDASCRQPSVVLRFASRLPSH